MFDTIRYSAYLDIKTQIKLSSGFVEYVAPSNRH